ncbi:MAG: YadA C-terminal domain-containing protein, partial [bacterium]
RRGIAGVAALTSILNPSKSGKTTLNLGIGHFKSESAVGLNMAHWIKTKNMGEKTKKLVLNGGASLAEGGEDAVYRVGIGMEF